MLPGLSGIGSRGWAQDKSPGTAPGTTIATTTGTTRSAGGIQLSVRINQSLSSKTTAEGDTWSGIVASNAITGSRLVIPEGTQVTGIVTNVVSAASTHLVAKLSIKLTSVRGLSVDSNAITRTGTNPAAASGSLASAGIPGEAQGGGDAANGPATGDPATGGKGLGTATEARIAAGSILSFTTK